jgi:hypothetical protein
MTYPVAKGERFLAGAHDFMSMLDIANVKQARKSIGEKNAEWRTAQLDGSPAAMREPAIKVVLSCAYFDQWHGVGCEMRSQVTPGESLWDNVHFTL